MGGKGAGAAVGPRVDGASGGQHVAQRSQAHRAAGVDQQHGERVPATSSTSRPGGAQGQGRRRTRCSIGCSPTARTSLDRLAFQKALDDIGANESAGTDFSLEVLSDHFDRGVQLLADNELHPALPEKAFTIIRKQVAAAVAGRLQSPGYLTGRALDAALYPKHDPTLRQATPATVSSLTIAGRAQVLPAGVPSRSDHHRRHRQRHAGAGAGGHREVFRQLEGDGTEAEDRPAAGAAEQAGDDGGARRQPRAGQGDAGGDVGAEPLQSGLLRAATGQPRARRRLLRHATVPRSARECGLGVLRVVVLRSRQDTRALHR